MFRHYCAALAAALLAGCGGGGGSSSAEYPVADTLKAAFAGPMQLQLEAQDGVSLRVTRGPYATDAGGQRIREHFGLPLIETTREVITISQRGQVLSIATRDLHYTSDPLRLYGTSTAQGQCEFVTSWFPPPETAAPDDGSALYVVTAPGPCAASYLPSTLVTGRWYVQHRNSGSSYVCMHVDSEDQCYLVSRDGKLLGAKVQAVVAGTTWLFE